MSWFRRHNDALHITLLGYSGVIALPMTIVIWWGVEGLVLFLLGGAAMGLAGERFAGGGQ